MPKERHKVETTKEANTETKKDTKKRKRIRKQQVTQKEHRTRKQEGHHTCNRKGCRREETTLKPTLKRKSHRK